MARYVPKTYSNRRGLRIIIGVFATLALSIVIIFLILFFVFQNYVVDGQLVHPLLDDWDDIPAVVNDEDADEYSSEYYEDGYGDEEGSDGNGYGDDGG